MREARRTADTSAVVPWVARLRAQSRTFFVSRLWALPVCLPTVYMISRAAGNVLLGVYALVGLTAVRSADFTRAPRGARYAAAGFAGVAGAGVVVHQGDVGDWVKLVAALSVTVLLPMALTQDTEQRMPRLVRIGALAGGAALVAFLAELGYHALAADFNPARQVRGLVPAYLLPLIFYGLQQRDPGTNTVGLQAGVALLMLLGLIVADSRTELLVWVTGVATWYGLNDRIRPVHGVFFVLLCAAAVPWLRGVPDIGGPQDVMAALDRLSSYRLTLWQQALAQPPADRWLGVGLGGVAGTPVVQIPGGAVKHLHNLFLDAWHETGSAGVLLLSLFLAVLTRAAWRAYRSAGAAVRTASAALLASAAAVFVAALFDPHYRSPHVMFYMVGCLAAVAVVPASTNSS